MTSLGTFILVYLIGGLTFVPLVITLVFLIVYRPWVYRQKSETIIFDAVPEEIKKQSNKNDKSFSRDDANFHKVGWLRVTKDYESPAASNGSTFGNIMKMGIQTFMDGKNPQLKRHKDSFFAVLKHNTLFMYDSERQLDCKGIIIVSNHDVSMYPEHLPDNEIFLKATSIKLTTKKSICADMALDIVSSSYYLYCSIGVDKEDWFFALQRSSKLESNSPGPQPQVVRDKAQFDQSALNHLKTLSSNDDKTEWLNVILGRIFLSVYKTQVVKEYFIKKLIKKVKKVKKPNFLSDIHIKSVNVGDGTPYITNPKLIELKQNGELSVELNVDYSGGFRAEIETEAMITVTRLRTIKVPLVLAVVLRGLAGKLLLRIKAPPTNRIWFGFYEMPKLDLLIDPIVSETQLKFSPIINAIESKIHEMIMDSIVLPNMDDTPFFVSFGKGGIYEGDIKVEEDETQEQPNLDIEDAKESEPELIPTVNFESESEESEEKIDDKPVQEKPAGNIVSPKLESSTSTAWIPAKERINRTVTSLHESFSEPNLQKATARLRSIGSIAGKHFKRSDDSSNSSGNNKSLLWNYNKNSTSSGNVGNSTDDCPVDTSITNAPTSNSPTSTLRKWSSSVSMRKRTASLGIASILTNNNNGSSTSISTNPVASISSSTLEKDKPDSIILDESSSLSSEPIETTPTPPPSPKDPPDFISPLSLYPPNEIDTKSEHSLHTNSCSSFKTDGAEINDQNCSPTKENILKFSMMQYEEEGIFSNVGPILNPPVEELNQVLG
ncbi:endoplasmic reticulum protein [Gigaspora margarita]|uniref:Endoplasmic reticulum protein n=1 Tax=Gigaspora margarita TaxID=4874 RepID=A0A8H3ZZL3_GIGMA|nr:endoplasmic reticulum protein [Gigaspora margarita]